MSTIPRVGVLALQGDVREHLAAFRAAGADVCSVRQAADLTELDALALPGGESTTMARLLRVFGIETALRQRLHEGMPCFATCAGLILLSRRILDGRADQVGFGALDVEVRRNAFGRQVNSFEADVDIEGLSGAAFPAMFIRAPRIETVGPAAKVIASYDDNIVAIEQPTQLGVHLGLSFHPEMTGDLRLHRRFLDGLSGRLSRSAA